MMQCPKKNQRQRQPQMAFSLEAMAFRPGSFLNIPSANSNSMTQLSTKVQDYKSLVTGMEVQKPES